MALELRQQLKLTQQLIMTPQLQMAIKLLQLSRLEMLDTIRQELEENPALEEVQDIGSDENLTEQPETKDSDTSTTEEVTIQESSNPFLRVVKEDEYSGGVQFNAERNLVKDNAYDILRAVILVGVGIYLGKNWF